MATCVKREELQGMMKYKKNNECLMAATTAKAASACTK